MHKITDDITANESVLDMPKPEGLDMSVWQSNGLNGDKPMLTQEADQAIQDIVSWVTSRHEIPDLSVLIIGSITSNCYSDSSDIDLDFCSHFLDGNGADDIADFGWGIKKDFIENYEGIKEIGGHPIEVFFQPNQFQCMMSVGCYDFLNKKWEVGPEMKGDDYDPVSDMYKDSMKIVNALVAQARQMILEIYEMALVTEKSASDAFKTEMFNDILPKIKSAGELYKKIKSSRQAFEQDPISKEDALKKRSDKRWKIRDAAFKFLDKFGYVTILKEMLMLSEEFDSQNISQEDVIETVIDIVKDNLATNALLADSERTAFDEAESSLNESIACGDLCI